MEGLDAFELYARAALRSVSIAATTIRMPLYSCSLVRASLAARASPSNLRECTLEGDDVAPRIPTGRANAPVACFLSVKGLDVWAISPKIRGLVLGADDGGE